MTSNQPQIQSLCKFTRLFSNNQQTFETIKIQEDSQFSIDDKIQKELIQKYTPQQRINLIVNKQTGQIFDTKKYQNISQFSQFSEQIHSNVNQDNWKKYWKEHQQYQQNLIRYSILGMTTELINLLRNKQIPIDINYRTFDMWSSIHFAVLKRNVQCLSILIQNKANINLRTKFGWTALHIAAKRNCIPQAILLIQNGANLNQQDQQFYTPLHYASESGYKLMVKLLLNYKCDQNIKNCQGRIPRQCSQNIDVYNIFQSNQSHGQNYSKVVFGGILLPNSRSDHVQRFLCTKAEPKQTEKLNKKQKNRNNIKFQNIISMYKLRQEQNDVITTKDFSFYKILGKGSFGQVFLVKKIKDQKFYALKILKKQKIIGTNLMRYIKTQRDVLSSIIHPFIVRLYYSFQNHDKLFLVMHYCQGGDMAHLLDKKGKLTQQIAKIYICQIILALQALHKNMIIYRDLKPQNIVIDNEGHVMLTDFGLSKIGPIQQMNSSFCGTPAYLPPQILQKKGHNRMADWYGLGVILYQFLVGTPPFYAPTREQLYRNKKQNILKIPRRLSSQCKNLLKSLLQRDPSKRLGIQKDGQSVRQHAWFKGIKWEDVYNRKLQPPRPNLNLKIGNSIIIDLQKNIQGQKKKMQKWTFVC